MMSTKREFIAGLTAAAVAAGTAAPAAERQVSRPGPDSAGTPPATDPYPGGYEIHAPAVPRGDPTFVTLRQGRLQGVKAGPVRYFRGVPFAQPPVGPLRFRPPEPAKGWRGTRLAVQNPPAPLQNATLLEASCSEDCLYLNVWAPDSPGPHPVYVYIHGGGNTTGYSLEYRVQGASFARDGIVCVNIAYRVGVLGFLELGGEPGSGFSGSGNNAMRDQLLAIRWVRDNIAAFGGDPERVTIGGQSAGGFDVCNLVASPQASGFFRGAISQSGGGHQSLTMDQAYAQGAAFARQLRAQGAGIADLQRLPATEILKAQQALQGTPGFEVFGPVVDGDMLADRPYLAVRKGLNARVGVMLGSNRDEWSVLGGGKPRSAYSAAENAAFARFVALHPETPEKLQSMRFYSEEIFGGPSAIFADGCSAGGHKAWLYRWNWGAPTGRFAGMAFHGIEQSFVWDNVAALAGRYVLPDPAFQARATTLHGLWCHFIRNGVPADAGVPEWPAWSAEGRRYLNIDRLYSIDTFRLEDLRVWQDLLNR